MTSLPTEKKTLQERVNEVDMHLKEDLFQEIKKRLSDTKYSNYVKVGSHIGSDTESVGVHMTLLDKMVADRIAVKPTQRSYKILCKDLKLILRSIGLEYKDKSKIERWQEDVE